MSRSCANCGAEVLRGASVCDNCGIPVSEEATSQEVPLQSAPAQSPLTRPHEVESVPDRRTQPEQSERLASSQATLPNTTSTQDQGRGVQPRGVSRWVIRAAGFAGTAVAAF